MNPEADNTTTSTPKPRRTKTVSQRQLEANRANAKKSTGPRTEAGRNISRLNHLKLGLTAGTVCFPGENKDKYEAERAEIYDLLQPANILERTIADNLAVTRWRLYRTARTINGLTRVEMARKRPELEETFDMLSTDVEISLAIQSLGESSNCLQRLEHHEARLERTFNRTLRLLLELRRNPPFPAVETEPEVFHEEPLIEPPPYSEEPVPAPEVPEAPPIGNAAAPNTVVLARPKIKNEPIREIEHPALPGFRALKTAAAGASSGGFLPCDY